MRYNRRSITVVSAPATFPVTLSDMKAFLLVTGTADDALIDSFIAAATDAVERYLRVSLITQTLKLTMDGFPGYSDEPLLRLGPGVHGPVSVPFLLGANTEIELPRGPVQSAIVTTYDRQNSSSVFDAADYFLDAAGGRIVLNEGRIWPVNLRNRAAVEVTYVAGYGNVDAVPSAIKQGIKQMVAAMYECRQVCEMPEGCKGIMNAYRRYDELGWR
jgi:hypothetical protein